MKAEIKPRINLEGRTRLETVIPLSTPYLVFLDPSDLCNQSCSFCPTGNKELLKGIHSRKPQLMDFGLYKKIIDSLCDMPAPIKTLRMYADGEPLLNPKFPEMVKYAKESGRFGQVDTTTNGSLLRPSLNIKIIESGIDKMFISVPIGYTPAYVKNVKHLYDNRNSCELRVKIVGDEMKESEKVKFMSDFGDIADRIFIEQRINCWPNFNSGEDPDVGIYGNEITNVKICAYLFYSLKINSDGSVSACFLDYPHSMILGNLDNQSFKSIWEGSLLKDLRIMHLKGHRNKHSFCSNCHQLTHGCPDNIDDYAEELLRRI